MFFLHCFSRFGVPRTSFRRKEYFCPGFGTECELRMCAARCLNWAFVMTLFAFDSSIARFARSFRS